MNIETILSTLSTLNMSLRVDGLKLILKGDKSNLTDELSQAIKRNKQGLIDFVKAENDSPYNPESWLAAGWSQEMAGLLTWLWREPNPEVSFVTINKELVIDQKKFYSELSETINLGPNTAPAKSGDLKNIIEQLRRIEL